MDYLVAQILKFYFDANTSSEDSMDIDEIPLEDFKIRFGMSKEDLEREREERLYGRLRAHNQD